MCREEGEGGGGGKGRFGLAPDSQNASGHPALCVCVFFFNWD
jgi:hypothetical protein